MLVNCFIKNGYQGLPVESMDMLACLYLAQNKEGNPNTELRKNGKVHDTWKDF